MEVSKRSSSGYKVDKDKFDNNYERIYGMKREVRVNLEKMTDLLSEMECPECKSITEQPEYVCIRCRLQLVFFIKTI